MNVTRTLLKTLLADPGRPYQSTELARAAGCTLPNQIAATPGSLANLRDAKAITRIGKRRKTRWMVENTPTAIERARAYLSKPERGNGRAPGNPFNRGTPRDETPREHAYPPVRVGEVAPFPPEPLRFTVDDDGDLQITGRDTGMTYLLIPKLDAVDLLEFARRSATHLEAV